MSVSRSRERLRKILGGDSCITVAQVYDTLSARIACALEWEVCKLAGAMTKAANLCFPDEVPLANLSDLVDICRRITRVADVSLIVDADDGGPTTLAVRRAIQELESAGVSAIEIQDIAIAGHLGPSRGSLMIPADAQVAKLRAAVAARQDPRTVIIARTSALEELPLDEALARVRDYSRTGVDAVMLPMWRPRPRAEIEAVAAAAQLPLCVSAIASDAAADAGFLSANRVRIRYLDHHPYRMAVKALYDGLKHLKDGGSAEALLEREASQEALRAVTRAAEFAEWERSYDA